MILLKDYLHEKILVTDGAMGTYHDIKSNNKYNYSEVHICDRIFNYIVGFFISQA